VTPTGCRVPIEDRLQHGSTGHIGQSGGTRPLESDVNVSGRDLRKMPVKTGWRLLVRADFFRHSPPDSRSGTEPPKTDPTRIRQLWFRIGPYPRRNLEARVGIDQGNPKNTSEIPNVCGLFNHLPPNQYHPRPPTNTDDSTDGFLTSRGASRTGCPLQELWPG